MKPKRHEREHMERERLTRIAVESEQLKKVEAGGDRPEALARDSEHPKELEPDAERPITIASDCTQGTWRVAQRPKVNTPSAEVTKPRSRGEPQRTWGRWWARAVVRLGNLQRRFLGVLFVLIGPNYAYRLTGVAARLLYSLLDPFRLRSEAQCRAALKGCVLEAAIPRIAERSFVNRACNVTDLMLASRFLRANNYHERGGRIPEPLRSQLLSAQRRHEAVILLTAYYGAFDLLPIFLGYNGVRATAIYLPHANCGFDVYRRRIRGQSGCELVPVSRSGRRIGDVLERGGTVALLADHHVERRGTAATFLGIKTRVPRSVGLLAWRYNADVVVAGIRRVAESFRFELTVADTIGREEIAKRDDPVAFVTDRYLRALERLILDDPTQYLWGYARWGEDHARAAVTGYVAPSDGKCRPVSAPAGPSASTSRVGYGQAEVKR